ATYRMLIVDLDDETARVSAVQKIAAVRNAGAAVVLGKRKPTRRPDLTGYPAADKELQRLADPLWARPSSIGEVLLTRNILPDFEGPFDFIHRKDGKTDIYFVAGSGTAECIFRVKDRRPELWCPVTGQIQTRVSWRYTDDDRTAVRLALPENGSVFVVFRTFDQPREFAPQPPPTQLALSGPWNVRFGSRSFTFQELTPWNEHRDPFIKYFSGTAVYRKSFELTPEQVAQPVWLQLGEVKHVAEVRLNGKNLGVVWTAPWEIEATGALKPGRNELEITVVNTWVNRLIGDAALPPRRRTAKTNVALVQGPRPPTLKPFQGFASDDPLMPSGLLGPVRLEFR
ncbi:MAG: glycosyl hydrolase, partial [Verrucomicrobiae bacterium]|nr:glycosyl hydrolase [Verrucomicrobiae bacterium]